MCSRLVGAVGERRVLALLLPLVEGQGCNRVHHGVVDGTLLPRIDGNVTQLRVARAPLGLVQTGNKRAERVAFAPHRLVGEGIEFPPEAAVGDVEQLLAQHRVLDTPRVIGVEEQRQEIGKLGAHHRDVEGGVVCDQLDLGVAQPIAHHAVADVAVDDTHLVRALVGERQTSHRRGQQAGNDQSRFGVEPDEPHAHP